jgi:predicted SnoaL-like aldol condensation-catalyzing enzyme
VDRRLIPLIASGEGSLYHNLSRTHVHNAEENAIATAVTTPSPNRDGFIRMFERVFKRNPVTGEEITAALAGTSLTK